MKKIITVLGARPQFVKASAVSDVIKKDNNFYEIIIHTGQHFDQNMSNVFFDELGIKKPDYFLHINGGNHGEMTGRMLCEVEKVLLQEKPDIVMVYGDTNSTLAGALAAAKLNIPVAHVEAGLRSFNLAMPEEINRILTDRLSRWLFAPTNTAIDHLQSEGFNSDKIHLVGDVMFDVALHNSKRVKANTGVMAKLNLKTRNYILATIHRAENTNDPKKLEHIVNAFNAISNELPVVWPVHPRTRKVLIENLKFNDITSRLILINPLSYLDMVQLERFAALIATDSGGVQKEAFFYQIPCVTIRDETEWVELVEAGWNWLVPAINSDVIINTIKAALGSQGKCIQPYGDGTASLQIVNQLVRDTFKR